MRFLQELRQGDRVNDIYLCKYKQSAVTKNGKPYDNVILQDKSGVMNAKIWEPGNMGIDEFDALDYVEIGGDVTSFNGALQLNIKRARLCRKGEYDPALYLPVSKRDNDEMYRELCGIIGRIKNPHLHALLERLFIQDEPFVRRFRQSSAAKTIHHSFIGGLMEHTLSVARLSEYLCGAYPLLNHDLLLTAALCHDIGKTKELSDFPANDYTDDGQLLGHIVIGAEMVAEKIRCDADFPPVLARELRHCILAHHGEYEYGSPKKPMLIEALALNLADNTDAKLETFSELLNSTDESGSLGYNRLFETTVFTTVSE